MANLYIPLPVPASNGVGASIDVSQLGSKRTILVSGVFLGTVNVEVSDDGDNFVSAATFNNAGDDYTAEISSCFMRVRLSGYKSGTPIVEVGGQALGTDSVILEVPTENGVGAASNVSEHGAEKNVVVSGKFGGGIRIQASNDGVNFVPVASFNDPSTESLSFYAEFVRVERTGVPKINPGSPVVSICSGKDSGAGGGGGGGELRTAPPEKWGYGEVPANLAAEPMRGTVSQIFDDIQMIRPGSITGINIRSSAAITAGAITATVTVDGEVGALSVVLAGGTSARTIQAAEIDGFAAGALVGIKISSSAALLPADAVDVEAWLDVQES